MMEALILLAKKQKILWLTHQREQIEVSYNKKEWMLLKNSIIEAIGMPSSIKLKDLAGIKFDVNEDYTKCLSWLGIDNAVFGGMWVCPHEPKEFDSLGERKALSAGDFRFYTYHKQLVLTERKTTSDILNGLSEFGKTKTKSPRDVNDQMARLLEECDIPLFILEDHPGVTLKNGIILSHLKNKVPWHKSPESYLENWLFSWQLAGIMVIRTKGIEHSVATLKRIFDYFQKENHDVVYRFPRQVVPAKGTVHGVNLLLGIPGIGETMARRIMESFGTARAFFNAEVTKRIFDIDRLGKKKAFLVDECLDEVYVAPKELKL